jgi:hypothetical protein
MVTDKFYDGEWIQKPLERQRFTDLHSPVPRALLDAA